jgi:hypothetical protein
VCESEIQGAGAPAPDTHIGVIALPTGKPAVEYERTARSFGEHALSHDRAVELVLMSDCACEQDEVVSLSECCRQWQVGPTFSAGRREKERYICELAKVGIDPVVAAFALFGESDVLGDRPGAVWRCGRLGYALASSVASVPRADQRYSRTVAGFVSHICGQQRGSRRHAFI